MPTEAPNIDTIERWLRYTSNYGMSLVFTACVLLLLIWLAWTTVSILKKWLPVLFAWSIRSHKKTCEYLDRNTETLACLHDNSHATQEAFIHATHAIVLLINQNKDNLKGGSDAIRYLEDAEDSLRHAERIRRRREEQRKLKVMKEQLTQTEAETYVRSDDTELPPDDTDVTGDNHVT